MAEAYTLTELQKKRMEARGYAFVYARCGHPIKTGEKIIGKRKKGGKFGSKPYGRRKPDSRMFCHWQC